MTKRKLRRAINNLVSAEIDGAFEGAQQPEDFRQIEENLTKARKKLDKVIDDIFSKSHKITFKL